jgi:hypothetical protein
MCGHFLKGFLVGPIIGLVLGSAIPALAAFGWVGGSSLQDATRNFQLGYVAGVDDAVQAIVDRSAPMSYLKQRADCLAKHHSSLGLGPFGDWALTLPRGEQMSAARLIIQRACE